MSTQAITQKDLAQILGVDKNKISALLGGRCRFGPKKSLRLEQLTGISLHIWLFGEPEEIKQELEQIYGTINFKRGRTPNTIRLMSMRRMAEYLGVSAPFLCEVRKGKKAFSKQKARLISEKTGISLEKVLFADGESLYHALTLAYTAALEEQNP
ncbi:hypothetical protein [Desulfobulbus sp.]|uniref:helix-turn-helix transcriptional regulator n=1 Tax=Desulfobulbus sp. TaxID=895 RepID=UPI00286EC33C|nr:hypothetical protein [Desulfobulbus sp.]